MTIIYLLFSLSVRLFIYFKRRYISFVLLSFFFHIEIFMRSIAVDDWLVACVCVCLFVCYHEWYLCVSQFDWFYLLHCWIVFGIMMMMMMMMPTFDALWHCIWYTSSFLNAFFRFVSSVYPWHHKFFFRVTYLFFSIVFIFPCRSRSHDIAPCHFTLISSMPSSINIFLSFHVWIPLKKNIKKNRATHWTYLDLCFCSVVCSSVHVLHCKLFVVKIVMRMGIYLFEIGLLLLLMCSVSICRWCRRYFAPFLQSTEWKILGLKIICWKATESKCAR